VWSRLPAQKQRSYRREAAQQVREERRREDPAFVLAVRQGTPPPLPTGAAYPIGPKSIIRSRRAQSAGGGGTRSHQVPGDRSSSSELDREGSEPAQAAAAAALVARRRPAAASTGWQTRADDNGVHGRPISAPLPQPRLVAASLDGDDDEPHRHHRPPRRRRPSSSSSCCSRGREGFGHPPRLDSAHSSSCYSTAPLSAFDASQSSIGASYDGSAEEEEEEQGRWMMEALGAGGPYERQLPPSSSSLPTAKVDPDRASSAAAASQQPSSTAPVSSLGAQLRSPGLGGQQQRRRGQPATLLRGAARDAESGVRQNSFALRQLGAMIAAAASRQVLPVPPRNACSPAPRHV
jgi:hypothetical protein